jgi:3'-phosphoadenosine 5'-phosphosulfate sulfotransferase (PAPS reductase)/FAD synthetase
MQSLPLESKEIMSTQRLGAWFSYWYGEVYVSLSGGKDSTVLADLTARYCRDYGYKLYLLFVNTGLEYPEIQNFVKMFAEWLRITYDIEVQLDIVRPEMRFDEVLKKYGYPVVSKEVACAAYYGKKHVTEGAPMNYKVKQLFGLQKDPDGNPSQFNKDKWKFLVDAPFYSSERCCSVMKKKPAKQYERKTGRKPIVGTMANESRSRYSAWIRNGCNAFDSNRPISQPLSFWTEQDVLHYIKKYNIPYASVYGDIVVDIKEATVPDEQLNIIDFLGEYEPEDRLKTTGCDRTGCIFCMFGCHLEKEPNRFQRLKQTHPRQYEYCIGGGEYDENGTWKPNKQGLGMGHVFDELNKIYGEDFVKYT